VSFFCREEEAKEGLWANKARWAKMARWVKTARWAKMARMAKMATPIHRIQTIRYDYFSDSTVKCSV